MTARVLVATGTKREASTLKASGHLVLAGGGDDESLRARLLAAADDAVGILSFGMAGALACDLAIGEWVIGDLLCGTATATCDLRWGETLSAAMPAARVGTIFADGRMIASAAEKRALGERHGAVAVDMESHVVAAVARERGLPFAIIRCISDEANHDLPPALAVAMQLDGGLDVAAALCSLVARPGQTPHLARVVVGFARAMRVLTRDAPRLATSLTPPAR